MTQHIIDNPRLVEIENVLLEYCRGNFLPQVEITGDFDIYDSFGAAINMLGEELSATTVNRDYFLNIFNEVNSFLLILNEEGIVTDQNKATDSIAGPRALVHQHIAELLTLNDEDISDVMEKFRLIPGFRFAGDGRLNLEKAAVEVTVKINSLGLVGSEETIIVTLNDISELRKKDHELVKAIITTQEQERNRFAQDLHDDIGQQLSGLKMFMHALSNQRNNTGRKEILSTCMDLIDSMAEEIRTVCFNLMPRTLNELGLEKAVELLISKLRTPDGIDFRVVCHQDNPGISKEFEVNVFRIIQEFINNSVKHSGGSLITISVITTNEHFDISLSDNGIGFDKKKMKNGMGLLNIATRARFINGEVTWTIKKGKGVHLRIAGQFQSL